MSHAMRLKKLVLNAASILIQFAHGGLLVTGILAALFLANRVGVSGLNGLGGKDSQLKALFGNPALSASIAAPSQTDLAPTDKSDEADTNLSPEMRRVADYLAHKYRVAAPAVEPLVSAAQDVGSRIGMDPMLILAVMAIESRFNPFAQSNMGAQGLMQVMPKYHLDKIEKYDSSDEDNPLLDPKTNIEVGARVLKESISRAGGVAAGLQQYAGGEGSYAGRVMAEKQRIEEASRHARRG